METYEFILGNTLTIEFEFPDIDLTTITSVDMKFYEGYSIEDGLTEMYNIPSSFSTADDVITYTIQSAPFITYKGDTVIGHLLLNINGYLINKYFKLKALME